MAWTYGDFDQYTDPSSARLDRLRLHIAEVRTEISNPQSSTGPDGLGAESSHNLIDYLKSLKEEEERLNRAMRVESRTTRALKVTTPTLKGMN